MFLFETLETRERLKIGRLLPPAEPPESPRVLLAWAEHCVECAAPACYASCDLFDPTPAGRCRRFIGGIQPNADAASRMGPGADIIFKRWGKLEAQGNAALFESGRLSWFESALRTLGRIGNRTGPWIARATRDTRWSSVTRAVHKRINRRLEHRPAGRIVPNSLVLDVFNPADKAASLLLNIAVDRNRMNGAALPHQLPRPFNHTITLRPGHTRQSISVEAAGEVLASGLPFNIALSPAADDSVHLVFRVLEMVHEHKEEKPRTAGRAHAAAAKCVIFDLDNTLWDGVLLEGDVELRSEVAELFRTLDERGILISVASKNAPEDALARLKESGLDHFLLFPQIGWGQKSEAIRRIARTIDIGLDSVMFVDDSPFERDEVALALADVEVLPETAIATLSDHPRVQGAVTAESRARRSMYQQAIVRDAAAADFGDDYIEFLRSCGMSVEIRRDRPEDFERIAELVQRTNQLNFSGRKYDRSEIAAILADAKQDRHLVTVKDRFGSYGMVGFCLSRRLDTILRIEDLMLSCRVQGRFIEQALLWHLAQASEPGLSMIEVNFKPTARNQAARMVLDKLGFVEDADRGTMVRTIAPGDLAVDFIQYV